MKWLRKIKSYLHLQANIVESVNGYSRVQSARIVNEVRFRFKYEELTSKALNDTEMGVSSRKYTNHDIIVSLTTHGKRLYDVHTAIESIMQGSVKPNRIILWISNDYKDVVLPLTLQNQLKRGLEIEFCKDRRSYTKLVYALQKYPDASIVTIDDDIIYPHDLLENLVNAHLETPNCICANWIRVYPDNLKHKYVSLLKWEQLFDTQEISERFFFEGFAGVLYPPHSLDKEVLNDEVYLDICKYADDVWFNAMAIKAKTKVKYAWKHYTIGSFIHNEDCQCVALQNLNNKGDYLNDIQIKNVFTKYNLWESI